MAALGADTPVLEAINAAFNAMNPFEYFKARLYVEFKINLDQWGPLEPGESIVFPLDFARTEHLRVLFNITSMGSHYSVQAYTERGNRYIIIDDVISRHAIDVFLKTLHLYLPYYTPQ